MGVPISIELFYDGDLWSLNDFEDQREVFNQWNVTFEEIVSQCSSLMTEIKAPKTFRTHKPNVHLGNFG